MRENSSYYIIVIMLAFCFSKICFDTINPLKLKVLVIKNLMQNNYFGLIGLI